MSRGKKLDIFIGADIEDGWAEIESPRKTVVANEILEPSKHSLLFKKEKRRGKVVTIVGEFQLQESDSEAILKMLKKKLGCGGTIKDGWMEFQGEPRDKLRALLVQEGFKFRQGH
ncbi:translation initiation factor [Sulfurimonas sp.]|uniref:translation initiation factor n=1 Tax=Sulfurimonas sp. TaxID=2022749 RepID=UPI0025DF34CA|nr:translation initiation factor [Sulfurimonas sp.]MCK9454049.1 translation initiation factor [Sulfurimonas sp.]